MEISLTSLGSSQTLRKPHFRTEAASRFCSFRDTILPRLRRAERATVTEKGAVTVALHAYQVQVQNNNSQRKKAEVEACSTGYRKQGRKRTSRASIRTCRRSFLQAAPLGQLIHWRGKNSVDGLKVTSPARCQTGGPARHGHGPRLTRAAGRVTLATPEWSHNKPNGRPLPVPQRSATSAPTGRTAGRAAEE
jgi:hypothetical protein